jgi:hypothetical protein
MSASAAVAAMKERKNSMTTEPTQRIKLQRSAALTIFALVLLALLPHSAAAQWTTNGNDINNTNSGNVGVGTTTPGAKLHVAGGIYSTQVIDSANTNGFRLVVTGPGDTRASWSYNGGVTTTRLTSVANVRTSFGSNGIDDRMFLDLSGNLGINTTTPGGRLHVSGPMQAPAASGTGFNSGFRLGATPSTNLVLDMGVDAATNVYTWLQSRNQTDYALKYALALNPTGGNVGVNMVAPVYSLDVNGGVNSFRVKGATTSSSDSIATFENNSAIQMIVRGNGNVGIGTVNPSNKLHVAGSITVDGNINAKYQDLAEWVDSSQALSAGTVVVLDANKSNQVIASTQAYDSRVAGVISLQPGVVLGEAGEGRVLVATTGRVKLKVDASNGPINIGDLLVTSDKEGFAMKSVPVEIGGVRIHRPGTLIGKALEPLASGQGEILVLLSLQ